MTTYLFPAAGTCNALVRFSIGGVGQVVTGREGTRRQRQFQTVESAAWKAGSHTVRFGADYRRMVPIRRDATGVLSAIADDITSLTDKRNLWLGSTPAVSTATEVTELSLWAQDTWQISPRFVITPGLRWELNPSPEAGPSTYFLDPQTGTFFDRNQRPLWPVRYANFAPRLGAGLARSQERADRHSRRRRPVLRFQPEHRHRPDQWRALQHHPVHQWRPRNRLVAPELRLLAQSATAAA